MNTQEHCTFRKIARETQAIASTYNNCFTPKVEVYPLAFAPKSKIHPESYLDLSGNRKLYMVRAYPVLTLRGLKMGYMYHVRVAILRGNGEMRDGTAQIQVPFRMKIVDAVTVWKCHFFGNRGSMR